MRQHRPFEIESRHVERLAVVYRQEVHPQEVAEPPGSPVGPQHERDLAMCWGWPEEAILVIEQARGASSSGTDGRDGFKRLRKLVAQEQVGIIVVPTISRLRRSGSDLLSLFSLCQDTDTLIALNGALVDLDQQIDYLLADIHARSVAEANQQRAEGLMMAKRGHAARGPRGQPPAYRIYRDCQGPVG